MVNAVTVSAVKRSWWLVLALGTATAGNALAAGQGGDALRAALQRRLGHESALVQEHVQWALAQRPQVASV